MIQQTSLKAYKEMTNHQINQRQKEVYKCLENSFFGLTNKLISKQLNRPINEITPRTNELVKLGLVKESHRAIDKYSTKEAIFWEIV